MNFKDIFEVPIAGEWWMFVVFAWVIIWKGMALWKAAQKDAKWWFVALLLINTFGILDILYIYVFSERGQKVKVYDAPSSHKGTTDGQVKQEEKIE